MYKTYFKSVGWLHSTIFVVGAMAWSVSYKFSGKLNSTISLPISSPSNFTNLGTWRGFCLP